MLTYSAREAKQNFGEVLKRAKAAPIAVKKHKRIAAYVISPDDFATLETALKAAARRRAIALVDEYEAAEAAGDSGRAFWLARNLLTQMRRLEKMARSRSISF